MERLHSQCITVKTVTPHLVCREHIQGPWCINSALVIHTHLHLGVLHLGLEDTDLSLIQNKEIFSKLSLINAITS